MDLDLDKLGKDTRQSLSLDHVRWFMYEVRCLLVCLYMHAQYMDCVVCVQFMECCALGVWIALFWAEWTRWCCVSLYAHDASHHHCCLCVCYMSACPHPQQLMKGLKYIHSAGIMHRDIKPANVLLSEGCTLPTEVLAPLPHSRVFQAATPSLSLACELRRSFIYFACASQWKLLQVTSSCVTLDWLGDWRARRPTPLMTTDTLSRLWRVVGQEPRQAFPAPPQAPIGETLRLPANSFVVATRRMKKHMCADPAPQLRAAAVTSSSGCRINDPHPHPHPSVSCPLVLTVMTQRLRFSRSCSTPHAPDAKDHPARGDSVVPVRGYTWA